MNIKIIGTLPLKISFMKRIITSLVMLLVCQYSFGQESFHDHRRSVEVDKQEEPTSSGFDVSRIFTGGGVNIGYTTTVNGDNSTNNTFNIGAIPEIGYSLNELFDLGIATSINYSSTTNSYYNAKQHNTSYSLGAFARVHPLENFFVQVMPEIDWGTYKTISSGYTTSYKIQSSSFLVGLGYGHRVIGESYFYTLLMLDLAKDKYSPYNYYDPSGTVTPLPVLRGGFNFYPFRKRH